MAKDFWDKFKISSEALKNNWPIILMALTAISSGVGNITQGLWLGEADETNAAMKEHIEYTNKMYVLPKNATVEKTTTPKIVVRQPSCGDCQKSINPVIKRIEKLERWH